MKKLLLPLILLLTLAACAEPPAPTYDTIPTPPSISTNTSPFEALSAALDQTLAAETLIVEYKQDGETFQLSGTPEEALSSVAQWIPNVDFLSDFCAMPLHAIPSNTGVIRYEVSDLTAAQLSTLLGREFTTEETCSVMLEVDAEGALAAFTYTAGDHEGSIRKLTKAD